MRRRYTVMATVVEMWDEPILPARPIKKCWTRKGAERHARLFERESWRHGLMADAFVKEA